MKKLISIFLAIMCFFCQPIVFAEVSDDANQDIIYTEEEQEIFGLLNALGIFTKDDVTINNLVTRGEFTEYALRLSGVHALEISQSENPLRFPDVVNSEYRAAVSLAAERGYVSGYGDGYFYPENYITLNEAATVMGNVLGYNIAEGKISTRDIYTGVKTNEKGQITQRAMAKVLFNALNSKTIELNSANLENYILGDTALHNFFLVETVTGVTDANDVTSISSKKGCAEDFVKINSVLYYDPQNIAWDMLGYNTKAYYKTNENREREIIFAVKFGNETLKVRADDISDNTTELNFCYMENEKEKYFSISPVLRAIDNYTLAIPGTLSMIHPDEGDVTFIDNNGDGVYDVLISNSYEDYFVSGIDAENGILYDKYGKTEIETEDKKVEIVKNGKIVDISSISSNDVVSVYESDNFIRMVVSSRSADGKVTETRNDGSVTEFFIDGEEYTTSTSFRNAVLANRTDNIRLNDSGKFYLNEEGKIVAFSVTSAGPRYAFLVGAHPETGLDKSMTVKLIDDTGAEKIYELSENAKVTIGTTTYMLKNSNYSTLASQIGSDQIVKYEVSNNLINKLYVSDGYVVTDYTADKKDSLNLNKDIASGYYDLTSFIVDSEWHCSSSTVMFGIPKDSGGNIIYDEITILDRTNIESDSYEIKVYDSAKTKIPGAVAIYNANRKNSSKLYNKYKSFVVVKNKYKRFNKDEDITETAIDCYYKGQLVTYATDTNILDIFDEGDIGQVALVDGKVYAARVFYKNNEIDPASYTDKKMTYKNTFHKRDVMNYGFSEFGTIYTNKTSECMLVHGVILEATSDYITVQYESDPLDTATASNRGYTVLTYPIFSWSRIYKVTEGANISLSTGILASLRQSSAFGDLNGTRVLINVRAQRIDEVFIFD